MKRKLAIFSLMLILAASGSAQTILLQVDRGVDSIPLKRGPNLDKFVHFFLSAGFVAGMDHYGARVKYFNSGEFGFGLRWKYKISNLYSIGHEWKFNEMIYKLQQEAGKVLPDSNINDVERMEFYSLQAGLYNRFNLDTRRGNYLGNYVDIGIRGEWDFTIDHITKNKLPDGSKLKASVSELPYVNHFNYQLFVRLGRSKVSLYGAYRLSDLFKSKYQYPELPALTAGADVAIFRQ